MSGVAFGSPSFAWLLLLWPALLFALRRRAAKSPRFASDFELWRRAAARLGAPPAARAFDLRDAATLLPLFLLTLAAADPRLVGDSGPGEVIVVLDRSQSMGATSEGATRIERGLRRAEAMLGGRSMRLVALPPSDSAASERTAVGTAISPDRLAAAAAAFRAEGKAVVVVTDRPTAISSDTGIVVVTDRTPNAGIVACAFGSDGSLLIRVAGDAGVGAREVSWFDAEGATLGTETASDAREARILVGPERGAGAVRRVVSSPGDGNPIDDVVEFAARPRATRAAVVAEGATAILRALAAQPEIETSFGADPSADLVVAHDAAAAAPGQELWLVPPFRSTGAFAAGPPRAVVGAGKGIGAIGGFDLGLDRFPSVSAIRAAPQDTVPWLVAGLEPLVTRSGRTTAWWCDPEGSPWAATTTFPIAVRRLLDASGLLRRTAPTAVGSALSRDETLASSTDGMRFEDRTPAPAEAESEGTLLAPWCAVAAALVMAFLSRPFRKR